MVRSDGTLPRRRHPLASCPRASLGALSGRAPGHGPTSLYVYRYWDIPYAVAVGPWLGRRSSTTSAFPHPRRCRDGCGPFSGGSTAPCRCRDDTATRWQGTGLRAEPHQRRAHRDRPGPLRARPPRTSGRATRRRLGIAEDAFVVLYAGRIGREKGVDVLVRAFAELCGQASPAAISSWWGRRHSGPTPPTRRATKPSCGPWPTAWPCRGCRRSPTCSALIQAADVAVAPSLWPEPLSRSVMEPLACGVPGGGHHVWGQPRDPHRLALGRTSSSRTTSRGWREGGLALRVAPTPGRRSRGRAVVATPRRACHSTPRSTPSRRRSTAARPAPVSDPRAGGGRAPPATPASCG